MWLKNIIFGSHQRSLTCLLTSTGFSFGGFFCSSKNKAVIHQNAAEYFVQVSKDSDCREAKGSGQRRSQCAVGRQNDVKENLLFVVVVVVVQEEPAALPLAAVHTEVDIFLLKRWG